MKQYIKNSEVRYANEIIVISDGKQIINPSEKDILNDGWVEYIPPTPLTPEELEVEYWKNVDYNEAVNTEIRKKYTESQEFSLLRQRDTKAEEFKIYNDYCEECKILVKKKKGMIDGINIKENI